LSPMPGMWARPVLRGRGAAMRRRFHHHRGSRGADPAGTTSSMVADLNPVLRGWGGYLRRGNSARKLSTLDSYVQERLAILDNAADAWCRVG